MSETRRPAGDIPVPYGLGGEVAPAETYYYPDYAAQPDEGTDWERVARLLWQRKWWILATVLLGTAAGWVSASFIEPEYQTFTRVWLEEQTQQRRGGPVQSGDLLQGEGWADVFRSRAVIVPVVQDMALQIEILSPDGADRATAFEDFEVASELVPGTYTLAVHGNGRWTLERDGDGRLESGSVGEPVGATQGFRWNPPEALLSEGTPIRFQVGTLQQATMRVTGALSVQYNPNSSLIHASLTWKDREEAAPILNGLADRFIQVANDLKAQKIREEVEMLREQTDYTEDQLQSAEFALQNHRVETITLPSEPMTQPLPAGGTSQAGQPDPVFGAFQQNRLQVDQLQYDLQQIRQVQQSLAAGGEPNLLTLQMIPSVGNSAELKSAIAELEDKQNQRRTLLYTYTEDFPQVQQITQQIEDLRTRLIPAALGRLERELQSQISLLERQIQNQSEQLREIPQRTIASARLQREMDHAATLHNSLLLRLKQAELAEATSGPGIEVLDAAWPPTQPLGERAGRLIALFSMASFGVGIAGVLLFDHLDKRIRYPDQVTGSLGLPVLGVVPRLEAAPDPSSPTAAIAVESFRGLRTQIAHVDGHVEGVTLVTSPAPREGKSMVSANLAISYATAGYTTALLDGDTRRGRAQEMFGLKRSPGLTDYLMERATLEQVLQTSSVDNLQLIARGAPGGFNADLLESDRMDELLRTLRERVDVVIVDGPPLAAGADVLMLGQRCDKVVVVLRAGATKEDLARAKLATLGNVELPIVGAVLNAMPKSAPYYEYYVHYYYADAELAS